jgi:hypothetical protein
MKRLALLFFCVLCLLGQASAQTEIITTSARDAFEAYRCDASTTTYGVVVSAYLANKDGEFRLSDYRLQAEPIGFDSLLTPETQSARRNPVRIVVVLDTTSTMPLRAVIDTFSQTLVPQLLFSDEVALITFTNTVAPITAFYTDKNLLINENMLNLTTIGGQNRIYDAVLDAVRQYNQPDGTRNIVLLITDSGRRDVDQTAINDIIAQANQKQVQIYNVALVTEDTPDIEDLKNLSESTNGFTWVYDNPAEDPSNVALEQSLKTIFNQYIQVIGQEAKLFVNLTDLNLQSASDITIQLNATLNDGTVLTDTIICPVPTVAVATQSTTIPNVISFTNSSDPLTTAQPIQIGVNVQTGLPASEQRIVFLQNGTIVQSSESNSYTFDTSTLPPGTYSITAQLRDLDNVVYATTDTAITINAQQILQLNILEGALDILDGALRIEALSNNPALRLPDVRFTINRQSDPNTRFPLGNSIVQNGSANLTMSNVRQDILRFFPNIAEGEILEIRATIPSNALNAPDLTQSEPLQIVFKLPPPPPYDVNLVLVIALSVALLLMNLLLFFRVGRLRVRRMIFRPDNHELPNRLMAVTVYRDGQKLTHTLTKKTFTIGRGGSNDINLGDDNKVSRNHGVIMWRKQEWYYTNRKHNTFAKINTKRVRGYRLALLEPVTEIEIGDARVFFHSNSQQDISEMTKTNL